MPQRQPSTTGVRRIKKSNAMHEEVVNNLINIALSEDKSYSYVVSEIVYAFFGLKVSGDVVKISRASWKKAIAKRDRAAADRNVRRVAATRILRFEKRRNAKRSA